MSDKLKRARAIIANQLGEWADELFAPDMKLTFIARHPTNSERELVISDDDMKAVAEVAIRSSKREAR
jgi:hypothetical protein